MNVENEQGYTLRLCGNTEVEETQNLQNITAPQVSYLISIEQIDGTSQVLELTKDQINALGLLPNEQAIETLENDQPTNVSDNSSPVPQDTNKPKKRQVQNTKHTSSKRICIDQPVTKNNRKTEEADVEIPKTTKMLHTIRSLSETYQPQIRQTMQLEQDKLNDESTDASKVIYRVVYPDELDLKPLNMKPPKKGRPKKGTSLLQSEEKPDIKIPVPAMETVRNVRTRSGRITRPPLHIKKDFKKIDTSEASNNEADLKITEFEPLKTNQAPTTKSEPVKVDQLENHQRKRSIAAQYRCPKCKKAYLGHSKMLKHLEQHPDHGPIPKHCKVENNDTWNYLIDISKKNPVGQRGIKFCKELLTFFRNVRILAKMFFKRPNGVDKNLYFVDSNLSNLLGIESGNYVLNENELHKDVNMFLYLKQLRHNDTNGVETEVNNLNGVNFNIKIEDSEVVTQTENQNLDNLSQVNESYEVNCVSSNNLSNLSELNSNLSNVGESLEQTCMLSNINFDHVQNVTSNFNLNNDSSDNIQVLQKLNDQLINQLSSEKTGSTKKDLLRSNQYAVTEEKALNSDLALQTELLTETSLLNSLPALRSGPDDELMLTNVDSTQVTNLLDNSTGSDEVMNVDQFVNERFKNLTEPELDLPNTSLNLDLPTLDLFQFHTS